MFDCLPANFRLVLKRCLTVDRQTDVRLYDLLRTVDFGGGKKVGEL